MFKKGDTFKLYTKHGYMSCVFGNNSWIIIHPTHEELNKMPKSSTKIISKYRQLLESDFSYISTKILLTEKNWH